MRHAFIFVLCVAVVSCASNRSIAPVEQTFRKSQTFLIPYESVWLRAVDWFADHNVVIEKIEKSSGLLTAKYVLGTNDSYLDCGRVRFDGTYNTRVERFGSLNVTVRLLSDSETKVTVNFFGEYRATAQDVWDGRRVSATGRCVSTGRLERTVLEYIESLGVDIENLGPIRTSHRRTNESSATIEM